MDRLLYQTYLLLLPALLILILQSEARAQKDAEKIMAALEKVGIDKPDAQLLSAEIDAITALYQQLNDSTIKYSSLVKYQKHYQTVAGILSGKKIKPDVITAAWPATKDMLSSATMRVVKRKIVEMEASDESVKYLKSFIALEGEMITWGLGARSRQYDNMSQEYLKKIEGWKKSSPEYENFFIDLRITVNGLLEIHKALENRTSTEDLKISKELRASVKRLRNVDFHRDNEFVQKFKASSLVEQTILTGEFLCENIK
jgi:nucleoside diphosphate kinase